jgi:rRNA processing protein Gar1
LLGISQSYISRLEKRIIKRLRKEIGKLMWDIIGISIVSFFLIKINSKIVKMDKLNWV